MIPSVRKKYNEAFTREAYQAFLADMNSFFKVPIEFRISETPVFIPTELAETIRAAGEEIIEVLLRDDFKKITEKAVPTALKVPNEDEHTSLLAIDFAICEDGSGKYIPQLIELQGFASLYAYQEWLTLMYRKHFEIPEGFNNKFNGYSHEQYIERLRQVIVGKHKPENVILLEIEPWKQKTRIDFLCTEYYIGIKAVCLSEIIKEGRQLFYMLNGMKTPIHRIYNRIIFDELLQRNDLPRQFNMTDDVDVEWVAHPSWFFRISKYTMPFLKSRYVPETMFLSTVQAMPKDLENWVLKPLFSFSGQGVIFDVTPADVAGIKDPENYILQRKVTYAAAVQSPTGPVKCEIRLLYLWDKDEKRPELTLNLGRMSKGKMIGVRYNQDLDWVGATTYFIEEKPKV
jgi:hypothetical protein